MLRICIGLVSSLVLASLTLGDRVSAAALFSDKSQATSAQPSLQPYLIALSVADLDASIQWYSDLLGFREQRRMNLPDYKLRIGFLERDGFRLELIEFKDSVPLSAIKEKFPGVTDRAKVQGYAKLAFGVPAIEKFAAMLKAKKLEFLRDITREAETGDTWFMITDPDGNVLQFFEVKQARPGKARRTNRLQRSHGNQS